MASTRGRAMRPDKCREKREKAHRLTEISRITSCARVAEEIDLKFSDGLYAWRDDDVRNRTSEQAWYERHIQAAILRAE